MAFACTHIFHRGWEREKARGILGFEGRNEGGSEHRHPHTGRAGSHTVPWEMVASLCLGLSECARLTGLV